MGDIKDMVESMSKTSEETSRQKVVDEIVNDIISKILKNAKSKKFHWVADESNREYYDDVYKFFSEEGFTIRDFQTRITKDNVITRETNFYICWK